MSSTPRAWLVPAVLGVFAAAYVVQVVALSAPAVRRHVGHREVGESTPAV